MITRTIKSTRVTAYVLNMTDMTTTERIICLPREYSEGAKLDKAISNCVEEGFKYVCVKPNSLIIEENLYGMTEQEFISHAKVLDPETRKILEGTGVNEVQEQDNEEE